MPVQDYDENYVVTGLNWSHCLNVELLSISEDFLYYQLNASFCPLVSSRKALKGENELHTLAGYFYPLNSMKFWPWTRCYILPHYRYPIKGTWLSFS